MPYLEYDTCQATPLKIHHSALSWLLILIVSLGICANSGSQAAHYVASNTEIAQQLEPAEPSAEQSGQQQPTAQLPAPDYQPFFATSFAELSELISAHQSTSISLIAHALHVRLHLLDPIYHWLGLILQTPDIINKH